MIKFENLTLKGQKMRIVKDAIKQINANKIVMAHMGYFNVKQGFHTLHWERIPIINDKHVTGLKEILQSKDVECQACAKGAIFASCVMEVNKVDIIKHSRFWEEEFISTKLGKWFTRLELDMIETTYEKKVIKDFKGKLEAGKPDDFTGTKKPSKLGQECIDFGMKYSGPQDRMLAILKNIVKNGKFTPVVKKKVLA